MYILLFIDWQKKVLYLKIEVIGTEYVRLIMCTCFAGTGNKVVCAEID